MKIFNSLKKKYNVSVLEWDRTNSKHMESHVNSIKIPAPFGAGMKNIFNLARWELHLFLWLLKNKKTFDCIHACDFDTAFISLLFSRIFNKKIIYDVFDYYPETYPIPSFLVSTIKKIDKTVMKKVDALILVDKVRIKQIGGYLNKNIFFIYNSPPLLHFRNPPSNFLTACFFGKLLPHRFIEEAMEVFSKNRQWSLHIAGFGPLEEAVKEFSRKFKNITYEGPKDYIEGLKFMSQHKLNLCIYNPSVPNHKYASPNKIFESLMLGIPIVVAENTSIDKLVKNRNLGWVIPYKKEALSDLLDLITLEALYKKSKKAKKEYYETYDWLHMEKELFKCYETIKRSLQSK